MVDYDKQIMSDDDYRKKQEYVNAYNSATTKEQRDAAHNAAEQLRAKYGYSGGASGADISHAYGQNVTNTLSALINNSAQQQAALNAAKSAGQLEYDNQIKRADQLSQNALREAYIKNLQNEASLNQQLRAAGVTGGAAESTRAAMLSNYAKNRTAIQNNTAQAISDIEAAKAASAADYDLQSAQIGANLNATYADYLLNAQNNARSWQANERQLALNEQQFEQDKLNNAYERALGLISNGLIDDQNIGYIAQSLGLKEDTIKNYIRNITTGMDTKSSSALRLGTSSAGSQSGKTGSQSNKTGSQDSSDKADSASQVLYDLEHPFVRKIKNGEQLTADDIKQIEYIMNDKNATQQELKDAITAARLLGLI